MTGVDPAQVDREKAELRREMRALLTGFAAVREEVSAGARRALLAHADVRARWRPGTVAMAYLAMPSEVDVDPLWAEDDRPALAAPRVSWDGGTMEPMVSGDPALEPESRGRGVREPAGSAGPADPGNLTLVLVPGVAFDGAGRRLGRGGGFYDRFLPRAASALHIGVCWSAQVVERVPALPHDRRVHMLLTEKGLTDLRPA